MKTRTYTQDTILKAKCPSCGTVNAFPEFDEVDIFTCHECGEPVEIAGIHPSHSMNHGGLVDECLSCYGCGSVLIDPCPGREG